MYVFRMILALHHPLNCGHHLWYTSGHLAGVEYFMSPNVNALDVLELWQSTGY